MQVPSLKILLFYLVSFSEKLMVFSEKMKRVNWNMTGLVIAQILGIMIILVVYIHTIILVVQV